MFAQIKKFRSTDAPLFSVHVHKRCPHSKPQTSRLIYWLILTASQPIKGNFMSRGYETAFIVHSNLHFLCLVVSKKVFLHMVWSKTNNLKTNQFDTYIYLKQILPLRVSRAKSNSNEQVLLTAHISRTRTSPTDAG